MSCPKNILMATFLYLHRVSNLSGDNQVIDLSDNDKRDVGRKIIDMMKNYQFNMNSYQKSSKEKENLPHNQNTLTISSKNNLISANFTKEYEKGSYTNILKNSKEKITIKSDFDVTLSASMYKIDNNSLYHELLKKEANKIVLENEDSYCYAYTSSRIYAVKILEESLSPFLEVHGISEYDISKVSNFIGESSFELINSENLLTSNLSVLKTAIFNFSETKLDFIKDALESNFNIIFNNEEIEEIFSKVKNYMNSCYKEEVFKMLDRRSDTFKIFIHDFKYNYYNENQEYFSSIEKKDDLDLKLSINTNNAIINPVYTIKGKDNDVIIVQNIVKSNFKYLNDDLDEFLEEEVYPSNIIFDLSESSIEMVLDFENTKSKTGKSIDVCRRGSTQGAKDFFTVGETIISDKDIVVIDESDKALKGNLGEVLTNITVKSSSFIGATGTFIDGQAGNVAYPLSMTMNNNIDAKELAKELTLDFGVFSIRSAIVEEIYKLSLTNSSVSDLFRENVLKYGQEKKKGKGGNLHKLVEAFSKDFIKLLKENELSTMDMNFIDMVKTFSVLLKKGSELTVLKESGLEVIKDILFLDRSQGGANFLKNNAGIQSMVGFIKMLLSQDIDLSIATREMLHGKKEHINFADLNIYKDKLVAIKENEGVGEYMEANYLDVVAVVRALDYHSTLNQTTSVSYLMSNNFDYMIDSYTKKDAQSKKNLNLILPDGMERNTLLSLTERSSKTTTDSMKEYYRLFLRNNGSIDFIKDDDKKKLFLHLVDTFQDVFLNGTIKGIDGKYNDFVMINYELPEELSNLLGDINVREELSFDGGLPLLRGKKLTMSVDLEFNKKEWDFLDKGISYNHSLINRDTIHEIINNFSSKGRAELIKEKILGGISPVIGSSRTLVTAFNVFDTLSALKEREDKNKPFVVLVVNGNNLKNHLKSVDEDFLKEHNIDLRIMDSSLISSAIDKTVAEGLQFAFISNISASARGIDISQAGREYYDEESQQKKREGTIIVTGSSVSPSDLIQFFSRVFNTSNAKSAVIHTANGGETVDISFPPIPEMLDEVVDILDNVRTEDGKIILTPSECNIDEDDICNLVYSGKIKLVPDYTSAVSYQQQQKFEISKAFNSGERVDVSDVVIDKGTSDIENILTVTDIAKKIIYENSNEVDISNLKIPK